MSIRHRAFIASHVILQELGKIPNASEKTKALVIEESLVEAAREACMGMRDEMRRYRRMVLTEKRDKDVITNLLKFFKS